MQRRMWLDLLAGIAIVLAACAPQAASPTAAPTKPAATAVATQPAAASPAAKADAKPGADEWGVVTVARGQAIKVGLGATFSGENAPLGIDIRNGATLAIEDVGEIKGFKVELVSQDDLCSGDGGRSAAERFAADQSIAGVVGMMCSGASAPAKDVLNRAHIVMISPSSTSPALTNPPSPIFNRVCWNDSIQGGAAARFARDNLRAGSAAIIHDGSSYGQGLASVFRTEFERAQGRVTAFEGITVGEKDFRAVLTRIAANRPDMIYFGGFIAEGALLVSQKADVGLAETTFMGADGINTSKYIEAAGSAAEGSYSSAADLAASPQLQEFRQRLNQRFGPNSDKLGPFHPQAYDAVRLMADKINQVAQVDGQGNLVIGRKALADAVRGTSGFNGLTGRLTCNENGDCGVAEIAFFQVKQGKFEKV